ncbi:FadR/GntR family transcriptional regulator [Roseivivax isoporae]|uniref:GntR family transcriptional regulator n=1 Tax=Roseivivax isoporae LMG 25204 TaxID=1449351 RepID=X7FA57_9RHOB|nr:FCD domain-containing protein [Roseivivax isoporae]ETX28986.1 GntR family transcriptional regulator [Roseivivax isoporae LMG 25204]
MPPHHAALVQLRAFLAQPHMTPNTKLPPERDLAEQIGVSRGELRKALSILEGEGLLWRHVGKGTFVGSAQPFEMVSLGEVARISSPAEVMRARLVIEPALCSEAAVHARMSDVSALRKCAADSRAAQTWREYEACDNRLHKIVADAANNPITSALYDMLAGIRRTVVWGRLRRDRDCPGPEHHSFAEHDAIIDAIEHRDPALAHAAMLRHLGSVERHLFAAVYREGAERS